MRRHVALKMFLLAGVVLGTGAASAAGPNGSARGQQPPVNVAAPSLSGTAAVGSALSASVGDWSGSGLKFAYQWLRCDAGGGSCAAVSGAAGSSYGLGSADAGATVRVMVTATNQNGSAAATSDASAVVAAAAPAATTTTATTTTTPTTTTTTTTTTPTTTTAATTTTTATTTTATTTTTAATTTTAPATYSSGRFVYCLGDASWSYLGWAPGWWYDGTSTGWTRDAADLSATMMSQRVVFDNSVQVMQTVSGSSGQPNTTGPCQTVRAEVRAGDPQLTDVANGAQASWLNLVPSNATNTFYGSRPSLLPQQGQDWWYGFAFTTNPGYTPQTDPSFPNWNVLGLEFHSSDFGGLGPLAMEVATAGPSNGASTYKCNTALTPLAKPRLEIDLTGGDVSQGAYDTTTNTCRRYQGPTFQAGHLYRVIYHVHWDAFQNGSLQVWIDGTPVVNDSGVSTLWRSGSTVDAHAYPQLQNYRKTTATQSTNIVYYGGVVRGTTQTDVTIP